MLKTVLSLTPADLGTLVDLRDVRFAEDRGLVAVTASRDDLGENSQVSRVVVATTAGEVVRGWPPTMGAGRELLPDWSPDGAVLAFVRHVDSSWQVVCAPGGRAEDEHVVADWRYPIEELTWSPDGTRLLFVAREPTDPEWWELPEDRRSPLRITTLRAREDGLGWTFNRPRQGYVVTCATEDVAKVSSGGYDDADFAWWPDGRSVLFTSQRHELADRNLVNDVFRVDLCGGEPFRLTDGQASFSRPVPSRDGRFVAVITQDVVRFPTTRCLSVLDLDKGSLDVLSSELDRDCNSQWTSTRGPRWLDDDRIAVLVEDAGRIELYEFSASSRGKRTMLASGYRQITSCDLTGETAVLVTSSSVLPPTLVVRDLGAAPGDEAAERSVFSPNASLSRDLRRPIHHRVATAPGVEVDSWLMCPAEDRFSPPHPVLVYLQGGGTQFGFQWSPEMQMLCGAGFAVLYLNARGSAGYGTAWMRSVCGPLAHTPGTGWGVADVADVVSVLDETLARSEHLDAARVGVLGGSYGALVTTFLLAKTEKFKAGWAERGPYNLCSDAGTNDESPWFFETYLGRTIVEDRDAYWEVSPLRLAHQITAPLAIVHSEEDRRCPIQQAEELFMALKLLGRPVELIRFPGEGHGLSRSGSPMHRQQRLEIMLDWFTRWLSPRPKGSEAQGAGTSLS